MTYAVEARIFNSGKIVALVREARPDEVDGYTETRSCDIWVDIFDTREEAARFAKEYRRA